MTYSTWDQVFSGNNQNIQQAQFGLILVRDYQGSATSMASYNPFDPVTGNLASTLLTTDGWHDTGLIEEAGVSVTPKMTTQDRMAWQSRKVQRTDLQQASLELAFTMLESRPVTDALARNIPLAGLQAQGQEGYQLAASPNMTLVSRQLLIVGVDYNTGVPAQFALGLPLVKMTKLDKYEFSDKNPLAWATTWENFLCPYTGTDEIWYREGQAWRNSGGAVLGLGTPTAAAVSGAKATLTFTPPTSTNGPFTYTVSQTTGGTTTPVTSGNLTITSSSPSSVVLTVAGLTAASTYTFTVTASATDGLSATSPVSNSITATS